MRTTFDIPARTMCVLSIAFTLSLAFSGCRGNGAAPSSSAAPAPAASVSLDYPIRPVPFTQVELTDSF
jgi:hypothetical protein